MCDPVTATAVSGAGMKVASQYQQGKMQESYYNSVADEQERQADVVEKTAEENSNLVQDQAARDTKDLKDDIARFEGQQKTIMAASGVSANSVTAEDISVDNQNQEMSDEEAIRYNADNQSWNLRKNAANDAYALRTEASMSRAAAKNAKKSARLAMLSSLASSASSYAGSGGMG